MFRLLMLSVLVCGPGIGQAATLAQGQKLLRSGDPRGASEVFAKLVAQQPGNGQAWRLYGYSLHADGQVEKALKAHIRAAKFPILLTGNGVFRNGASAELRAFADATGIPAVNTFMGKGGVAPSDPYSTKSTWPLGQRA